MVFLTVCETRSFEKSMSESPTLPLPQDFEDGLDATPGGKKEVHWVEVAQTFGLAQAQILAGRLKTEGIPVYAWQEGAGQAAGLLVGLLGAGHVMVPQEYEEQALEILSDEVEINEADEVDDTDQTE
jgi:hypothetical protein